MIVVTFDTETTGLVEDQTARIVEIGAVRHNLETGEILGTFENMVCPPSSLLDPAKFELCHRISGIKKDEILMARDWKEVMQDFVRWVDDDLVYAWNLPFDQRMIQRYVVDGLLFTGASNYWMDQVRGWSDGIRWGGCWQHLYAYMHPERAGHWENGNLKTISMKRAITYEGWKVEQDHRALADAKLAAQIGHIVWKKLKA